MVSTSYDAHLATAPQHIPTQHDMLPQHLVCKYELKCEYCNITLARNKAPWWWSDKIETWRSVLKCFKSVLCEIICAFVGWWIEVKHNKKFQDIKPSTFSCGTTARFWYLMHLHSTGAYYLPVHPEDRGRSSLWNNCTYLSNYTMLPYIIILMFATVTSSNPTM